MNELTTNKIIRVTSYLLILLGLINQFKFIAIPNNYSSQTQNFIHITQLISPSIELGFFYKKSHIFFSENGY